jgi:predicted DNA-binding transcriptional regulator YafY
MNIFDKLFLTERIDHLIRTRATGTPSELASRLNMCERHVYRIIDELRDQGLPIAYDKTQSTYYYSEPVELRFSMSVNGKKLLSISGGQNNLDNLSSLTFFSRERTHL